MNNVIEPFDVINKRYKILKEIGSGVYGKIFTLKDEDEDNFTIKALKVHNNESKYNFSIKREKQILEELTLLQLDEKEFVPILYKTIKFKNHICFIMKLYDINLYEFQKNTFNNKNYNINLLLSIIKQLFQAIEFIHKNKIIHCDIKPENILFKKNTQNIIICDFGLSQKIESTFVEYIYPIQSTYYRAPEVSIKTQYNTKIDIWSIGTIIYELLSNNVLINGKDNYNIIGKIVTVIGNPSNELINSDNNWKKFFNILPYDSSYSFLNNEEKKYTPFSKIINKKAINNKFVIYDDDKSFDKLKFIWLLLKKTIKWDMNKRLSATQILDLFNENNY